jgi:hypothetical protein
VKAIVYTKYGSLELKRKRVGKPAPKGNEIAEAFAELKPGVHAALETYSNVHGGSGHGPSH